MSEIKESGPIPIYFPGEKWVIIKMSEVEDNPNLGSVAQYFVPEAEDH